MNVVHFSATSAREHECALADWPLPPLLHSFLKSINRLNVSGSLLLVATLHEKRSRSVAISHMALATLRTIERGMRKVYRITYPEVNVYSSFSRNEAITRYLVEARVTPELEGLRRRFRAHSEGN